MTPDEDRAIRLGKQLEFIREVDKLKQVGRQTLLMDGSRYENDAEHSWHLCVMALLLAEYSQSPVDMLKVLSMVVIHDLVEIYAGDTFCYDSHGNEDKAAREQAAADRLFARLPDDQAGSIRSLWEEFEKRATPDARFAAALDRLQPVMHNYATGGAAWKKHGVTKSMVLERNAHIREGSEELWSTFSRIIADAVDKGFLADD